jgi:arylsulfatase A-like enzyme
MTARPNFLVIVADQLRADALGAFGRGSAATPRLDQLATRGTTFTNAFVQHPVCSPSRASFLTGWYPHTSGHRTLDGLLRADEPNFLKAFRDGAYHVAWAGDRGDTFAPGATELSVHEHGFAEAPSSDGLGSSKSSSGDRPTSAVEPDAGDTPWERLFYGGRKDRSGTDFDEAAVRTVESWLVEPPSEPWLMFVPLLAPHCPFAVEEPWFSLHARADQPLPVPPLDAEAAPLYLSAIREKYGITWVDPHVWQEVAAVYQGMVSRLDHHVGRIVDALETIGASDDTVIAFFSDHREYLGDFGVIEKWPSAMHPCITRDPLIIGGGGLPAGQTSDAMVEIIDVLTSR